MKSRALKCALDLLLFLTFTSFLSVMVTAKEKDKGNYIPCQKVFVTGNQSYSVQWANKSLFKKTCLAPQATPDQATAILDLEPIPGVGGYPAYTPKEDTSNYWIDCHSAMLGGVTCEDSEGHQTTTTCSFVGGYVSCSTYSGPDPITGLVHAFGEWLTRNGAYAYLYDAKTHELLWKYQGSWPWENELMFASSCVKKRRGGTWGTAGGVPNGISCDEQKLPPDLLQAAEQVAPATQPAAQRSVAETSNSTSAKGLSANMHAESDPSGADIEVDGSFVGNTPSDIQVTVGEHTVAVKKKGFKDWERKLKVSAGSSVRLNAELEEVKQ
jgi:hypothetical protein